MARSKGISYGSLIVKQLHTTTVSTCSKNTKILKDTTLRAIPSTTFAGQARRGFCDLSGKQELPPPTSGSNWGKWTAGIGVTTMIISFLQFKEDVDFVIETTEEIIDAVEVISEAVDMVTEKLAEDLPDGSKLKATIELIEDMAETVAVEAQKAVAFIE
ncbi:hypothetical protein CTI12_AA418170 [Artemisia annua]|uniref:Uncharacterized protein n=1 Tax=Artemisia annua TaxID=35608 RepID=A0A2U1M6X7_ARTAN|nr:hypothetical protein CTI12_AA418170 [Artemisia annua]